MAFRGYWVNLATGPGAAISQAQSLPGRRDLRGLQPREGDMQLWHELLLYLKIYLHFALEQHRIRLIPPPGSYCPFFSLNSLGGLILKHGAQTLSCPVLPSAMIQLITLPPERCPRAEDSVQMWTDQLDLMLGTISPMNVAKNGALG